MEKEFRYNWYETNIAEFLDKYSLPVQLKSDKNDITDFIKRYSEEYLSDYDLLIRDGKIKGFIDDTYKELYKQKDINKNTFEQICDVIKAVEQSELSKAESIVNEMMANAESDLFITSINGISLFTPNFYRIRERIDKPATEICKKDLFHIPYNLRHLTNNERFSVAGQPCLYLSTFLNIAWKECGMPKSFYYSKYEYDYKMDEIEPWQFLTLANPRIIKNDLVTKDINDSLDLVCRYLRTFPIVMACSITNLHKHSSYKTEYIFPQLIMQWIHRNTERIKGVIYYSCVYDTSSRRYNGYNIAIPATDFNEEGYSIPLLNRFNWSIPQKRTNEFTSEARDKIESFFMATLNFQCRQVELSDCICELYDIANSIYILSKKAIKVDSDILIIAVESISCRIDTFTKTYDEDNLINKCRNSETYQERYEEEIIRFQNLLEQFEYIKDIIIYYRLHIDHGYCSL